MRDHPERHQRRSIRLKGYDYSQSGIYFITICTHSKEWLFGHVVKGKMRLSSYGRIVKDEWLKTAYLRGNIVLDKYVVMPNHFHGILMLAKCRGTARRAPTKVRKTSRYEQFGKPICNSVPTIIRSFKSAVTKRINELRNTPSYAVWQRNYYEHVIRNDYDLNEIRQYILNNPLKWQFDKENPNS
jgi:REP element-mobilizing transposase RayT